MSSLGKWVMQTPVGRCPPPLQALRRQRAEVNIELRKAKKDEQILKRRSISFSLMDESLSPGEDKRNEVGAGCSAPRQDQCRSLCSRYHLLGPLLSPARVTWVK